MTCAFGFSAGCGGGGGVATSIAGVESLLLTAEPPLPGPPGPIGSTSCPLTRYTPVLGKGKYLLGTEEVLSGTACGVSTVACLIARCGTSFFVVLPFGGVAR